MARLYIPTHWDIRKVYKRLILAVSAENGDDVITTLMEYILHGSLILSRITTAVSTTTILLQFWRTIKMTVFPNKI